MKQKVLSLVDKYFLLWRDFGFLLFFCEVGITIVGKIDKSSALYMKLQTKKHKLVLQYLYKNYQQEIDFMRQAKEAAHHKIAPDAKIWVYWAQGFESAPPIIQACLKQLKAMAGTREVIELTNQNYTEYVTIPKYIIKKVESGAISLTHFSDILRLTLLAEHGGIWVDSTIWVSQKDAFKDFENYSFYTIKSGDVDTPCISKGRWSAFCLASGKNNVGLSLMQRFLHSYWKKEESLIAYLLIDYLIAMIYEECVDFRKMVDAVPVNNQQRFVLMRSLAKEYDANKVADIQKQCALHKLTYKVRNDAFLKQFLADN